MYAAHVRRNPTSARENVILCYTMESLRVGIQNMRAEEAVILSLMRRWKPCFSIVCCKVGAVV